MANNFADDPNCVALWRMENGSLISDSIGNNTLTPSASPPTANVVNYKEGSASGNFDKTSDQHYDIADASLDEGFPLKSGDSIKKISVAGWCYLLSNPPISASGEGERQIFLKWTHPGTRCFGIVVGRDWMDDGSIDFQLWQGYNGGVNGRILAKMTSVQTGRWYHFVITYDDSDRSYRLSVWDDTAQAPLDVDITGTAPSVISVNEAPLVIGWRGDHPNFNGTWVWDGLLDEIVVFKDVLTTDEIDQIRQGTFGSAEPKPEIATWPNLWPERYDYPQGVLNDPTIKQDTFQGRLDYRSDYVPSHRTWSFILRHLTPSEKDSIDDLQEAVGVGVEPFYWTDVRQALDSAGGAGGMYLVQLREPLVFDLDDEGEAYQCKVNLIEHCG